MAKKQTRRSISVSRTTYERLKAFCEANNISMSQLVETRVNDFLGNTDPGAPAPRPTPMVPSIPRPSPSPSSYPSSQPEKKTDSFARAQTIPAIVQPREVPMTSVAARFAVEPPPPIIKINRPKTEETAPKPTEKRPDQIFTF